MLLTREYENRTKSPWTYNSAFPREHSVNVRLGTIRSDADAALVSEETPEEVETKIPANRMTTNSHTPGVIEYRHTVFSQRPPMRLHQGLRFRAGVVLGSKSRSDL